MASVLIPIAPDGVYSDYASLQAGIIDWSQRSDLSAKIPAFIEMAERAMFRELPLRANETTVTGTATSDIIALPVALNAIERVEIETNSVKYTLTYTSPNGIEDLTRATGLPTRYTVENGSLRFISAPADAYAYTIFYMDSPAYLSDGAPSNAILAAHPDLYLWGALTELARYVMDPEMESKYLASYGVVLQSIRRADERRRLPVSGGLQIKPRGYR